MGIVLDRNEIATDNRQTDFEKHSSESILGDIGLAGMLLLSINLFKNLSTIGSLAGSGSLGRRLRVGQLRLWGFGIGWSV